MRSAKSWLLLRHLPRFLATLLPTTSLASERRELYGLSGILAQRLAQRLARILARILAQRLARILAQRLAQCLARILASA